MIGQQKCTGTGDHVPSVLKLKKKQKKHAKKLAMKLGAKAKKVSKNIQILPMTFKDLQTLKSRQ